MKTEPFDLGDYRQRVFDRTTDYELRLDSARVVGTIAGLRARVDELEQAASNALVYLQNALTPDFARGSDKAVRVELATVLGVEVE
jgi:hypothetical protein